jgi:hypothetical protein
MKFYAFSSPSPLVAVTDASGAYDVTFDLRSTAVGTEIMVEKPGYEPSWHWTGLSPLDAGKDLSRNFRLHQIRSVPAGESVHLSIDRDDPLCGFDFEWVCRRIRVRSSARGTLTVEAVADNAAFRFGVVIGSVQYPYRSTPRLTVRVDPGSEISADILFEDIVSGPVGFRLIWNDPLSSPNLSIVAWRSPASVSLLA